ncbi:carbohydrate ABC transporter permease [Nocardioides ultimimeridianus]
MSTTLLPAGDRRQERVRFGGRLGERIAAAGLVSPALFLLILFLVIPVVLAFSLAFTNARLVSPRPAHWVGLENFRTLFSDPVFLKSLRNTLVFTVIVVPVQAALALGLALLVNAKVRGRNIFRTIYFFPVVTSMVVVSILWELLYQRSGLINQLLDKVTFGAYHGHDWLNDPHTALGAIIVLSIWQAVGFHMIIWLSGLQTIPAELYEAADIDGTTGWEKFRYVTWPGLRHTRTFILITITIAAFGLFTQVSVITKGGPLDSTSTVVYQAVHTGYDQQQTAYASAISLVFFVMVLLVSLVQRFLTREKG